MLPELLDQIPPGQEVARVTADGACDTRKCHDAIAARGAAAVMPPRRNGKPWKEQTAGATVRNEALRATKHLGRALRRRWSGHHRRSPVETKMYCVNRRTAKRNCRVSASWRFGIGLEPVAARCLTLDRQVAESRFASPS